MRFVVLAAILTGCSFPEASCVEAEPHFECMVMCEATRQAYKSTRFDDIRRKVEQYCYKQCNTKFAVNKSREKK